ncbi:cellulose binding domain-containing protein [Micromonospora sp. NBC_01813]|uniref:cellulose binding domain-containing protein n=1 Tax=Micromonospora sp. NBC_01813 TaxID=2975988 RepID=UPI002DDA6795|nr:cellulose binding domain-containing protein [Micromonospora sp. NBC_01813]WSA10611.1 cellulose binding domain-containing protein [Micromonospora sp. NBC_01813]
MPGRPRHRLSRLLAAGLATIIVAAGAVPASTAAPAPAPAAAAAATRIMPLGDSITGSPGCWRADLWNQLQNTGYQNIDFVGTLGPQGCGLPYDGDNEGHGGALVTTVASQNQLPTWLSATRPDVVLMHFGTNDVWSNRTTESILAAYDRLVDQMRASNPAMTVLVAQLIPMAPATCGECAQRVVTLNAAIPGWAADKHTSQSPVIVVDQWTGFSTTTDTYDGVHPNAAGDQKISDRWYPALTAALTGGQPSPSTPPTTAPPMERSCAAAYRVVGQWSGGFQSEVTVSNTGTTALTGWSVQLTYGGGQQVNQAWNASVRQTGATVTATNVGWNGTLAPNGATTFGFLASWQQSNPTPTVSCATP